MLRWSLISTICMGVAAVACASDCRDIAAQFVPDDLYKIAREWDPGLPVEPEIACVFADLDGTGNANYIVAGYSVGIPAAVRVIRTGTGNPELASAPEITAGGNEPRLELRDLDGDGRPEVIAEFSLHRGGYDTVLMAWRDKQLVDIGPSADDLAVGLLLDLDDDGSVEAIDTRANAGEIYRLSAGRYQQSGRVIHWELGLRVAGKPKPWARSFEVSDTPATYMLRIVNGDDRGGNRTTSAVVSMNGKVIAGPESFKNKDRILTFPVKLPSTNELSVEMRGEPESMLFVLVEELPSSTSPN